jgi:hypothetical protein
MNRRNILVFTNLILFFLVHSLIGASDIDTQDTPLPVDHKFAPRAGTYYYLFDLNDISIGSGSVIIGKEGDLYKVNISAQTNSTIDRLYRIRYKGENLINTDNHSPIESKIDQQIKSVKKETTISFQDDGTIKTLEKKHKKGKTDLDTREIHTEKFTLDPISVAYLVRVLDWKAGVEQIFDIYNGKNKYLLRLKCTGMTTFRSGDENRDAWVIVPVIHKISRDGEDKKKKPIDMKILVSADETKDVLEIDASHKFGHLRAVMERFEPADFVSKVD